MQNSAWETLLRHIPPEHHNRFMVVTTSGVEIAVQGLLRIEAELVVLKGRLSGSQDQGRIFFIPYANLDYLGTAAMVKDTEFNELFGSLQFPQPATPQPQPPAAAPLAPSQALQEECASNESPSPPKPGSGSGARPAIRSEVLERFRSARTSSPSSSGNLPRPPTL